MNETMDSNYRKFWFCGCITHQSAINRELLSKLYHSPGSKRIETFIRQQPATLRKPRWPTAVKKWQNKSLQRHCNRSARAFYSLLHFLTVLCKTATWNHQIFRGLETANPKAEYSSIFFGIQSSLQFLRWGCIRIVDNWRHYGVTGKFTHCAECLLFSRHLLSLAKKIRDL